MEWPLMPRSLAAMATAALLTAGLSTVTAQPAQTAKPPFALPPESITVTVVKPSDATIKSFVDTRAVKTPITGRMARWTKKICPLTIGLRDTYANYITQRIRDVAVAVGAEVNSDPHCRPNVEIVFTTVPQALLDNVRKIEPLFLGYHNNLSQADALAKVSHPIQSWYTTETIDIDGARLVDNGRCVRGTELNNDPPVTPGSDMQSSFGTIPAFLPCAIVVHATGSRANDGISSGFFNVLVVAEPAKLLEYEVGTLADYAAMMALSQPASFDSCQELPSISNLLVPGCSSIARRITDGDLAYLRGLYKMPSGITLSVQYNQLEYQMKKVLVTDKGG